MATTTPNFGWAVPTSTDLVKDGAVAIETLGDSIDASLVDLKGGTTNQVLAKNSNTDMDFKWVSDATGMTNPMTTTGDTIYSSSGSTPARLGIGTTGQVLTVSGGVPSWATPAGGGGKVLQVVQATTSTGVNVASTTYTDTGVTATITPTLATSKVLVFVNQTFYNLRYTTNSGGFAIKLVRGGTDVFTPAPSGYETDYIITTTVTQVLHLGVAPLTYLDTPNTTSATTYKVQGRAGTTANSATVSFQDGNAISTILLMEIGA